MANSLQTCGICNRPIKKISAQMLQDSQRACGICRYKRDGKKKGEPKKMIKKVSKGKKKPKEIVKEQPDKHSIEYCLNYLATTSDLWDMRAWNKHKDINEVGRYIDSPTYKNNGHAVHCIERLKYHSVDKMSIILAIMNNPHIQYKDRLVPCMMETDEDAYDDEGTPTINCEKVRKQGHYGGGICNKCEGKPEPLEFEIITAKENKVKVKFDRAFHNHFEFYGLSISETEYRSHFQGCGKLDFPDDKIPELAKVLADKFEIELEIDMMKKERQSRRKKKLIK